MGKYTPMIQQYLDIKEQHQDAILFFRLGDFYEMFFDDALKASKILHITLTGREGGGEEKIPMCGIPYHSASSYISKLIEAGMKVAICEQVSDPAKSPGLVEREVVRVLTPGTLIETSMLDAGSNNYIAAVAVYGTAVGLAYADVSTGMFRLTEFNLTDESVFDELIRLSPVELVVSEGFNDHPLWEKISAGFPDAVVNTVSSYQGSYKAAKQVLLDHFGVITLDCFDCEELKAGSTAAGILMGYLKQLQKASLAQFTSLQSYRADGYMVIDSITRKHLELVKDSRNQKNTLFQVLNYTKTAMGNRLLKEMVQQPLMDPEEIGLRLDAVEELTKKALLRGNLAEELRLVNDLERLASRTAFGQANTRDLLQLKSSLEQIPELKELTSSVECSKLSRLQQDLDPLEDVVQLIDGAIDAEGSTSLTEGNIIKDGFNSEVDNLRDFIANSKEWLLELEQRERQRTGIKSLKVKYNKVFGYFLEVTKSNLANVPEDYIRKQTLVNSERFITEELKNFEGKALGAEDKLHKLEYDLFCEVRQTVAQSTETLQKNATTISQLDVLQSLAEAAAINNYTRPTFNPSGRLKILDGRHPVVEQSVGEENFVPNDVIMDVSENRIFLLTGPNMSGKSTYLRMTAIVVLMAQIGSFVPASEADICLTDRIFTRIGASDDISTGRSTFMVEMSEVANILHNAGDQSLILLDEVGRGTATYDGLSLAWAIVEHLTTKLNAKTLFATHYHELTALADRYLAVKNYYVAAKEVGETIAFLHKVLPGKSDRSYGIQVARLAGLPSEVVKRAENILQQLERTPQSSDNSEEGQGCLFCNSSSVDKGVLQLPTPIEENEQVTGTEQMLGTEQKKEQVMAEGVVEVLEAIRLLDLQHTTPMEALNLLLELQGKVNSLEED